MGEGAAERHDRWIGCKPGFFLPVRVLSRLFRRLFLEALEDAFYRRELQWFGETEPLQDAIAFHALTTAMENREWVVYCKPPFGGAQQALEYLGRYTHRVAISNERLLAVKDGRVTFQWKDYRRKQKHTSRVMDLGAGEFIHRMLIHTLPSGFQRIRHYGFLANRHRREKLDLCRRLLRHPVTELLPGPTQCLALLATLTLPPPSRCPKCKTGVLVRLGFVPAYRWPERPPDSS